MWVEIQHRERQKGGGNRVTSHTGCVSRNKKLPFVAPEEVPSHPTRDVWVEISNGITSFLLSIVTSHTGCVSRNCKHLLYRCIQRIVTSHTGCVSRNFFTSYEFYRQVVTSHTGCVSRNYKMTIWLYQKITSHPTRDVWVEIVRVQSVLTSVSVTSHMGCVNRNEIKVLKR